MTDQPKPAVGDEFPAIEMEDEAIRQNYAESRITSPGVCEIKTSKAFEDGARWAWNLATKLQDERVAELVEALQGLTNAALAGLKPLPSQIEAGFAALQKHEEAK